MKAQIDSSKRDITRAFPSGLPPLHSSLVPCNNMSVHYSFDFAQQVCDTIIHTHNSILINAQVEYPHNPQQPGPIYFLAPRKCGRFGVCCEAVPRQVSLYNVISNVVNS